MRLFYFYTNFLGCVCVNFDQLTQQQNNCPAPLAFARIARWSIHPCKKTSRHSRTQTHTTSPYRDRDRDREGTQANTQKMLYGTSSPLFGRTRKHTVHTYLWPLLILVTFIQISTTNRALFLSLLPWWLYNINQ